MDSSMNRMSHSRRSVVRGLAASTLLVSLGGCTRLLSGIGGLGTEVQVHRDLVYGPEDRHRLDLFLPPDLSADTPLLLFLYGGSWKWGSRARYGFVGYELAEQGIAVAVADYRLYPEVRFPDFNFDAAQAAAWLQARRADYGLAAGPLHLMGHSAGAHIAALLALDPRYLDAQNLSRNTLGRVVGLAGPYAMYPSTVDYIADIFPQGAAEATARPVTFADRHAPEMLLLHGMDDGIVVPANSTELAMRLQNSGAQAQVKLYDGIGHKELIVALVPPFQGLAPVANDVTTFIKAT